MTLIDNFREHGNDWLEKQLFSYDRESLESLNDEELDTEFRFLSAMFTRTLEKANEIAEVMQMKECDYPEKTALWRALDMTKKYPKKKDYKEKDYKESNLEIDKSTDNASIVAGRGSRTPIVALVGASPSALDLARQRAFSGPVGKTVRDSYLPPLGLDESDVWLTNIVPEYLEDENGRPREPNADEIQKWASSFKNEMQQLQPSFIVALGRTAADALEGHDEWLPHPRAVYKSGDTEEVQRKMARLADKVEALKQDRSNRIHVKIASVDEEKRVVYGVVIEPEVEDADGNWATEDEILDAAHRFALNGMVLKHEHSQEIQDSLVVETYIAPVDMQIGDETVKSGTWIIGTKVFSDERWNMVKSGQYTGYSLGGRAKIDESSRL